MALCRITVTALLVCACSAAQQSPERPLPRFKGRDVTVTIPETDIEGFVSKGPASICLEAPPRRQCYTAPEDFGRFPEVELVEVTKGEPALFFSVATSGVSGYRIHLALLRPTETDLQDLLMTDASVTSQSQHAFFTEPSISDAPFLITADYYWGPDESHFSPHRFVVSAYVRRHSFDLGGDYYFLRDRYMTVRSYDLQAGTDVIATEKVEILARLRRVNSELSKRRLPK